MASDNESCEKEEENEKEESPDLENQISSCQAEEGPEGFVEPDPKSDASSEAFASKATNEQYDTDDDGDNDDDGYDEDEDDDDHSNDADDCSSEDDDNNGDGSHVQSSKALVQISDDEEKRESDSGDDVSSLSDAEDESESEKEMNLLGTECFVDHQKAFYRPDTAFLSYEDVESILHGDVQDKIRSNLATKLPFDGSRMGVYSFVVSSTAVRRPGDVSFDAFRPWNKTLEDGTDVTSKTGCKPMKSGNRFKYFRGYHPYMPYLSRRIRYLCGEKGEIKSPILYEYCVARSGEFVKPPTVHQRTSPGEMSQIRDALCYRTTTAAKTILKATGVEVKSKTIYNCSSSHPTSVKSKRGKSRNVDHNQLLNLKLSDCKITHSNDNLGSGKPETRTIVLFKDLCRLYLEECPSKEQLLEHKSNVQRLLDEEIQEEALASFLTKLENSQYCSRMENVLQLDTTFDISKQLVTPLLGFVNRFRTASSGKPLPIMLGLMIHLHKDAENHKAFGNEFCELAHKLGYGQKCVPSFVSDGEVGLRSFLEHSFFDETTVTGCDIHIRTNLVGQFGKKKGDRYFWLLFGKRKEEGTISAGLLNCFSRERFEKRVARLQEKSEELYTWVSARKNQLFNFHGRYAKSKAGFFGHLLSTNGAENNNNVMKLFLTSKCEPVTLITKCRNHNREVLKKCEAAFFGIDKNGEVTCVKGVGERSLDETQKAKLRKSVGLPHVPNIPQPYRSLLDDELLEQLKAEEIDILFQKTASLTAFATGSIYFIESQNSSKIVKMVEKSGQLESCKEDSCTIIMKKAALCPHVLAIVKILDHDKARRILTTIKERAQTATHLLNMQKPGDASKHRRGTAHSKTNHIRRTFGIERCGIFDTPAKDDEINENVTYSKGSDDESSSLNTPAKKPKKKRKLFQIPHSNNSSADSTPIRKRSRTGRVIKTHAKYTPE